MDSSGDDGQDSASPDNNQPSLLLIAVDHIHPLQYVTGDQVSIMVGTN